MPHTMRRWAVEEKRRADVRRGPRAATCLVAALRRRLARNAGLAVADLAGARGGFVAAVRAGAGAYATLVEALGQVLLVPAKKQ